MKIMDKCMNGLSVCMLLICVKGKVGKIKGSRKKILIKSFVQEEEGKMRGIDIT